MERRMSREQSHGPASALQGESALLRVIGTFALTAAVINSIVGGGIFRMPSALATQMGAAAPLALVAGAFAIVPIALCFAAVGSRVQVTGGPYSYLTATFGPFAGFVGGALVRMISPHRAVRRGRVVLRSEHRRARSERRSRSLPVLLGPTL